MSLKKESRIWWFCLLFPLEIKVIGLNIQKENKRDNPYSFSTFYEFISLELLWLQLIFVFSFFLRKTKPKPKPKPKPKRNQNQNQNQYQNQNETKTKTKTKPKPKPKTKQNETKKNKTKQNKTKKLLGHIPYCKVQIKSGNPVKSAETLRVTIAHLDAGNFVH